MKRKTKTHIVILFFVVFIVACLYVRSIRANRHATNEVVAQHSDNISGTGRTSRNTVSDKTGLPAPESAPINVHTVGHSERMTPPASNKHNIRTEATLPLQTGYREMATRIDIPGNDMSPEDMAGLYDILHTPSGHFPGMTVPEVAAIKNRIMDKVLEQQTIPRDFGEVLVNIYHDASQDVLVRNFAVQHFDLYANALNVRGLYDELSNDAIQLRLAINRAAYEADSSIAGSALLGMIRLSQIDSKINKDVVTQHAAAYAGNASVNLQSRIAAVQICGEQRITSAIPALRNIIADNSANTVLRMSAQRALKSMEE